MPALLRIREFVREPAYAHFARTPIRTSGDPDLHCHDFHEVFWIERGRGWHHLGGKTEPLAPGDLRLVHADDVHGFTAAPGHDLVMANLAFSQPRWRTLIARYPGEDPFLAPISRRRFTLEGGEHADLLRCCADGLDGGARDALAVERPLLAVLALVRRRQSASGAGLPPWLGAACATVAAGGRFRAGGRALIAASAGRSPEHVARAVRRHLGCTPTDLVNRLRLAHAATRLADGDEQIAAIALDCGIANLGYFYRLFSRAYGLPPAAWRRRARRITGG